MEELHSVLHDLQAKLNSIVNRIPESKTTISPSESKGPACSTSSELPGEGCSCSEQYHSPVLAAFYKWARINLSLFIDKVSHFIPNLSATNLGTGILRRVPTLPQEPSKSNLACSAPEVSSTMLPPMDS